MYVCMYLHICVHACMCIICVCVCTYVYHVIYMNIVWRFWVGLVLRQTFIMEPRVSWDSKSSWFHLSSAGIIGISHHV